MTTRRGTGSAAGEGGRPVPVPSDVLRLYDDCECCRDGYPVAWHTIKHHVREQAGHRCVRCGHPYRNGEHGKGEWSPCDERCWHGGPVRFPTFAAWNDDINWETAEPHTVAHAFQQADWMEAKWRILTVHHLDGDKRNCRWWNLAALCQRCHLTIQTRVRLSQVFPYEHSAWFKPYAAGYYAHAYLNQELSREQTLERLDDLLSLERLV